MKKMNLLSKFLPYVFLAFFLITAYEVNSKNETPLMFVSKQDGSLNVNSSLFNYFNLGLKRFISSSLWISTILESDIEHYKKKDLNSWMYLRFKTISDLEPMFYENYAFGGPYLSIIKDDLEGASYIYKKGLSLYPDDQELLKNAAFHFYFELKDLTTAYPIFKKLRSLPNTDASTLTTLSRMEANLGNLEEAYNMLSEIQNKFPKDLPVGKKVYDFRYSIKAEMDLSCLNKNEKGCSIIDLDNHFYIKDGGVYRAYKEWVPYRPRWSRK